MRNRCIKPAFWKDEQVALVTRDARLLFTGLWGLADSWGALEDRPRWIRVELFPYDDLVAEQVVAWIDELVGAGLVVRYDAGGKAYLWIPGLREHQLTSMPSEERRNPPKLPLPAGVAVVGDLKSGAATVATATTNLGPTSDSPMGTSVPPQWGTGDGGREMGDGGRGTGARHRADVSAPEIRLAAWITVRSKDPRREAENIATLHALVDTYGEAAVQRAAAAWAHREHAKAYPDQLLPALGQAAQDEPPPEDPAMATARALIAEHGWRRIHAASGYPDLSTITDDESMLEALRLNPKVLRSLPQRLQTSLAGGSAP